MNTYIFKQLLVFPLLLLCLTAVVQTASAAPMPQRPDLQVELQGPASAFVRSPYIYTVTVRNVGNANASDVALTVDLPLTDTSPTSHILGTLSGIDSGCQVVSNRLECSLGRIRKNRSASLTFNFAFPVSTKTLTITAAASTPGETNTSDNTDSVAPNLSYPSNILTSATVLNSHCTGQNLTSYFECELFPSSLSQHTATLNSGGTVDLGVQGYTGNWYQPTPWQLHFTYSDGTNTVAEFNGFAVSSTCFEGLTTFPNSNYVSPYKVCVQ
ncbi:MAG: CARDB domain-containing protein [Pyrinomonadaceae bacterium]